MAPGISIYTRSCNDVLYDRMIDTLEVEGPITRCTGMDKVPDAINYLHYILTSCKTDWLLNIDEDLVVLDNDQIYNILRHMDGNFIVCGMPDGGTPARSHNPLVPNPFFNIFDMRVIRPALIKRATIDQWPMPDPVTRAPWHLMKEKYVFDRFECFYGLFFWLLSLGNCYYLESKQVDNLRSTKLIHEKEFLHHAWYSRMYGKDDYHTLRIKRVMGL